MELRLGLSGRGPDDTVFSGCFGVGDGLELALFLNVSVDGDTDGRQFWYHSEITGGLGDSGQYERLIKTSWKWSSTRHWWSDGL